jgi:PPE family protein/PE family protein
MSLWVEVDELHAAGTDIAGAVAAPGALAGAAVTPAAGDQVSVGVATALSAHFGVLAAHSAQGAHVIGTAAGVLHANAATYQQQEDLNTAALRSDGGTAPTAAPASGLTGLPPSPAAAMPAMPLSPVGVTPTDGKMIAALIHGGAGPQRLLDAAHLARTHAAQLRDISVSLRTATTQLNQGWQSPAADAATGRITALSGWYDEHARHAATAAQACETQAEAFAHTRAAVPRPEVFDDVERRLLAANRANAASGGRYTPVVTQLQTQLAATHTQALNAYADYSTRAADLPTDSPTPPPHVQAVDNHTIKQDPPPNPLPPQIGPFPVPPQVAAAAPPGPPRPIDPTGGLLTPQNLPPAPPPPNIPGVTPIPPANPPIAAAAPTQTANAVPGCGLEDWSKGLAEAAGGPVAILTAAPEGATGVGIPVALSQIALGFAATVDGMQTIEKCTG